jgi:ribosomal protein S7
LKKGYKLKFINFFFDFILILKYFYKYNLSNNFNLILLKIRPLISFKYIVMGGKKYKIPFFISDKKTYIKAIYWLILYLKDNKKNKFVLNLINEYFKILNNNSLILKKRNEHHLLAFENKSYLRFLRYLI